jgi:ABC-type transporter Mla subunit MlaD
MENLLIIAITVTALAVVIQAGILVALYVSVSKSSARMEAIASDLHKRALPALDAAGEILASSKPRLEQITENLAAATTTLRGQVERVDSTMSDVLDRARLQVIRADEMVTRTLDRVEETTEVVQHTVISPVKQLAGIISGLSVGAQAFFGFRRRSAQGSSKSEMQDEELFI